MRKPFIACVFTAALFSPFFVQSQDCKPQPKSVGLQISKVDIEKLQSVADSVRRDTTSKGIFMTLYYGHGAGELTIDAQLSPKKYVSGIAGYLEQGTGWAWQNGSPPYLLLWNTLSGHPIDETEFIDCARLQYESIIEWNMLLILDRINPWKR